MLNNDDRAFRETYLFFSSKTQSACNQKKMLVYKKCHFYLLQKKKEREREIEVNMF